MRTIRFRFWHKEDKEMIYGEYPTAFDLGEDHMIWMQDTDLLDKNGTEIYEGDVLDIGNNAVVCFGRGRFQPRYDRGNAEEMEDDFYLFVHDCEVIGNKYENPELLEVKECTE